jgi:uncharacterized membrane protein
MNRKKEEGRTTMNRMIRSRCSTLGKAVVLCAFALALVGDTSTAFGRQESDGAEQQKRDPNSLTFTQIDFPGAVLTGPLGINDRRQIVGVFLDTAGIGRGFLLDDGIFTEITRPDGSPTMAFGINDRGQIVGTFVDAADVLRGYLLDRGVFTQIDFPGATFTQPQMINNRGQIVGSFADASGAVHNFLLDNGAFSQIDFPGAAPNPTDAGNAIGINDRGQIVSQFTDAGGVLHGYILENNIFTQFDVPHATATGASDINNRGQIVGAFGDAGGGVHGYLFDGDVFTQFDFPGGTGIQTGAINDRGQVVGISIDSAGALHGFLASKEQFNGNAISVGAGQDNAAVEIAGTFTSQTDLDLSAATLTITNLLKELAGGGELVSGLPLVLTAVPGSRSNVARFVDQSRPKIASATILDAGPGKFIFRMKVDDVTINSPQNCSPTRLTTGFRLDAANTPPIAVSTERSWFCSGPSNTVLETH